MKHYQFNLLRYFTVEEMDYKGNQVHWEDYEFNTMLELDRIRHEVGSPCRLIRGGTEHDPANSTKLTAVDAVFPGVEYGLVVMALFRSGYSKGLYQGGSFHLDNRMGPGGLARCWMAFKKDQRDPIAQLNLLKLKSHTKGNWDYYNWSHPWAFDLLQYMIVINNPEPPKKVTVLT